MPELPDVEGFRQVLLSCGRGRRVTGVRVRDAGVLRGVGVTRLRSALEGRRLGTPWRHGKWLFVPTEDGAPPRGEDPAGAEGPVLAFHFGMTGSLRCGARDEAPAPHDRIVFTLDGPRSLRYRDQRKLQGVRLTDAAGIDRIREGLGPDALSVHKPEFEEALAGRRGAVKSELMDQSVIAGLGNLLCDEILWRARVAPRTAARDMDGRTLRGVHTAMGRVLKTSVHDRCVPPRRGWLTGRRDDGDPHCPRCGSSLRSGRVSGRRTVWCPVCQP
ncbi:DNA-formamidopyrimidine glycosylase family protein [Streptomyces sp. NPDC047002]|uniref:Fpg/Nei family DNA glycosylase n=1 Tax=Streptomyces sp. NPDC047002 TaxID=3155475 RepID=UPI00345246EE